VGRKSRSIRHANGRRAFTAGAAMVTVALAATALAAPAASAAAAADPGAQQPGTQQSTVQQPGTQQSGTQQPATQQPDTQQPSVQQPSAQKHGHRHLCAEPTRKHQLACHAIVSTDPDVQAAALGPQTLPSGYGPPDLRSAYGITTPGSSTATVAVVDAYNNPNAESDLAVYRTKYGLPTCTTASGCFRKVDQKGGTHYPANDSGWAGEISLDLDMVSAVCPGCHILLVEAAGATMDDLGAGVNEAVTLGAKYVSNSYGGAEDPSDPSTDTLYFNHPGVAITASAGDSGYGVEYPAASGYVTAVGGTSLAKAANARGWTETVWSTSNTEGTGSGCSADMAKPRWQTDRSCPRRSVSDVAAVADPNTGVAVYDTFGSSGWNVYGGTSAAAPIVAAIYALAGPPGAGDYPAAYPYQSPNLIWDVTGGSNGTCGGTYYCTAGTGYDGPTGWGTPHGTGAFAAPPVVVTATNGDFETGSTGGWTAAGTASVSATARHSGAYGLQLGSTTPSGTSTVAQTFTAAVNTSALSFWYRVVCPDTVAHDWATATLADLTAGTTATPLARTCVGDSGWVKASAPVTAGHRYTLTLTNRDDGTAGKPTRTYYDDVAVS
jgi:hypothetical protein